MRKLILALSLLVLAACQQQATVQPQAFREAGQTYIAILEPTASPTLPARFSERLAALERAHGLSIPVEDRLEALGAVILRNLTPAQAQRLAPDPTLYPPTPDQEVRAYAQPIPPAVDPTRAPPPTTTAAPASEYPVDPGTHARHVHLSNKP